MTECRVAYVFESVYSNISVAVIVALKITVWDLGFSIIDDFDFQ